MSTFSYMVLSGMLDHKSRQMAYTCDSDLAGLAGRWSDLTTALNAMGEHGAELCGVIPYQGSPDAFVEMIFKTARDD